MRLPVGDIDIDREAGGGIPASGNAVAAAGCLEGAGSDVVVVQV